MNFIFKVKVVSIGILNYVKNLIPLIKISRTIQQPKNSSAKICLNDLDIEIKEKLEQIWTYKYKTDKICYGYVNIYARIFKGITNLKFNILAFGIGIDKSNPIALPEKSLQTWAELCKSATIYGFDIDEQTFFKDDTRIHILKLDQTKLSEINLKLSIIPSDPEGFEIWIDDGLHEPSVFLPTLRAFLESKRSQHKTLVIEDLWFPYALINFIILRLILPIDTVQFYNFKNIPINGIKNKLLPLRDFYGWSNVIVISL